MYPPDPGKTHAWYFYDSSQGFKAGLLQWYQKRDPTHFALYHASTDWTQHATTGRVYLSGVATQLNGSWVSQVNNVRDEWGNVTLAIHYKDAVTEVRRYNYTYLSGGNYTTLRIRNRLTSATVTGDGTTITLVSNSYDGTPLLPASPGWFRDSAYSTAVTTRGNVTGQATPGRTASYQYDITGMLRSSTRDGVTVLVAPTADYRAPASMTPASALSLATTMAWTPALAPQSVTQPNVETTSSTYDALGRVATTTSVFGAVTTMSYPDPLTSVATVNGRWMKTTADSFGRTVKVEQGSGSTTRSIVETEYGPCACSPLGKVRRVSMPYAPGSPVVWTTYDYDEMGRVQTVTQPGGAAAGYTYERLTTTITDPAGKWKTYERDIFGNLVKVTEPNPAGGANLDSLYTYTATDKLRQVSMTRTSSGGVPVTQTRTWNWNAATQRLTSVTMPESGTTQFFYNANGTLQYKLNARGQRTQYGYDFLNRPISVTRYRDGGSTVDACRSLTMVWDQNLVVSVLNNYLGRVSKISWGGTGCPGGALSESYGWGPSGVPTGKLLNVKLAGAFSPLPEASLLWKGSYDTEGRLVEDYYPTAMAASGSVNSQVTPFYATYGYDAVTGRMSGIFTQEYRNGAWQAAVTRATGFDYNTAGQLTAVQYSTGYVETRTYDDRLQLTGLTSTGPGPGIALAYGYGAATQNNGQVQTMTDGGETVQYQYDALQRLTSATAASWSQSFAYDGFGNLVTKNPGLSVLVNMSTNRINGYAYDADGNVTNDGTRSYAYDAENRMETAGSTNYAYDPANRRVWDGSKYTFWSGDGRRLGEYTVQLLGVTLYVTNGKTTLYAGGRPFASGTAGANGYVFQAVVTDRLGSVRVSGGVARNYYPYGEDRGASGNGTEKFGTYYRDADTGLDYANQRYYSSTAGRFMSADPYVPSGGVANPSGWNRYSYVLGDPINFRDTLGLGAEQSGAEEPVPQEDPSFCDEFPDAPSCWLQKTNYAQEWVECTWVIRYRSVNNTPAKHAYIEATLEAVWGPKRRLLRKDYFEGGPEHDPIPTYITIGVGSLQTRVPDYLNFDNWDFGRLSVRVYDRSEQHSVLSSSRTGADICDQVTKLNQAQERFRVRPDRPVYHPRSGPNSNSYVRSLLEQAGLSIPEIPKWLILPGWTTPVK